MLNHVSCDLQNWYWAYEYQDWSSTWAASAWLLGAKSSQTADCQRCHQCINLTYLSVWKFYLPMLVSQWSIEFPLVYCIACWDKGNKPKFLCPQCQGLGFKGKFWCLHSSRRSICCLASSDAFQTLILCTLRWRTCIHPVCHWQSHHRLLTLECLVHD